MLSSALALGVGFGCTGTLNIGNGAGAGTLVADMVCSADGGGLGSGIINFNHNETAYSFKSTMIGAISVNQIGSGTTILTRSSSYMDPTKITAGRLVLANQKATGDSTVTMNGGNLGFDSSVAGHAFSLVALAAAGSGPGFDIALEDNAGNPVALTIYGGYYFKGNNLSSTTYAGVLSGRGSLAISDDKKVGKATLTLAGANTYSGATILDYGVLKLANQNAVQNSTVTMNGGDLVFSNQVSGHAFTFGGLAATGSGTGYNMALQDDAHAPHAVTLSVGNNNADTSYAALLTGAGSLVKIGSGTLTLSGANTFSGTTILSGGALNLANQNAVQNSTVVMSGGGLIFDSSVSGHGFTLGGLAEESTQADYYIALRDNAGNPVALSIGNDNADTRFYGSLRNTGSVTKIGAGTLEFVGQNTYTGETIVNGGTLKVWHGGNIAQSSRLTIDSRSPSLNAALTLDGLVPSSLTSMGNVTVGGTGNGTLTLETWGTLYAGGRSGSGSLMLAVGAGSTGTLNIGGGNIAGILNAAVVTGGSGKAVVNFNHSDSITFATRIGGNISVNQIGSGTTILTGSNTYAGATAINNGTLALIDNASIANSPLITVAPGAVLDVSALNRGALAFGTGQTLTAGRVSGFANDVVGNLETNNGTVNIAGTGSVGRLTLSGNLILNGGQLAYDFAGVGVSDLISIGGSLSLSGTTSILPHLLNGGIVAGTYTLISGGTGITGGDGSNLSIGIAGARQSFVFDTTTVPGTITMTVSGAAANLVWLGTSGSAWDTSTVNWSNAGTPATFCQLDQVAFDDTASNGNVVLTGTLQPGSVAVNNSATSYIFGGPGRIAGSTSLVKSGTGSLTLATANNFSGGVNLNAGQLNINNAGALGTGVFAIGSDAAGSAAVVIDNTSGADIALAGNNAQKWNQDFTFVGGNSLNLGTGNVTLTGNRQVSVMGGTLTVGGTINDGGNGYSLAKDGAEILVLGGTNTFGGGINLNAGQLNINSAGALGAGLFAIGSGAGSAAVVIDNTSGADIALATNNAQKWNQDFTFVGSNSLSLGTGNVTLAGNLKANVSGTLVVGGVIDDGGKGYSLTKTGWGTLSLSATSSYSGATVVMQGALALSGNGMLAETASITNFGGASNGANGGATQFFDNASSGGTVITNNGAAYADAFGSANGGVTEFRDSSTAGSAGIINYGGVPGFNELNAGAGRAIFGGNSNAGTASINNNGGETRFQDNSDAGTATIANNNGGLTRFEGGSTTNGATITNNGISQASAGRTIFNSLNDTAGHAIINNNGFGFTSFTGCSTAGGATINNYGNIGIAQTYFWAESTAGNATISNYGGANTVFTASSTAGSATLVNLGGSNGAMGGGTCFYAQSDGGAARLTANGNGFMDISGLSNAGMNIGSIEGSGNFYLGGKILIAGGNSRNGTVSGVIQDGGSFNGTGGSLTKTGSGTMTLAGANTYTGQTTILQGTLALSGNGSIAYSPSITVASGAVLDVSALNRGAFAFGTGQALTAGGTSGFANDVVGNLETNNGTVNIAGTGSVGRLTLSGNLTLNGGQLAYDFAGTGANDLISIGGALSLSGTTIIQPNLLNGGIAAGSYTLINSGKAIITGNATNMAFAIQGTRQTIAIKTINSRGEVDLNVSGSAANLAWLGTSGSTWDISTANWNNAGNPDRFYQLDRVAFDDTASNGNIVLTGTLQPGSVAVNNTATSYIFGGPGRIAGSTSLVKSGTGSLTLATANSFSGGVNLNAGQLNINNAGALGSGVFAIGSDAAGSAAVVINNTSGADIALAGNNAQKWNQDFTFVGGNSLNLGTGNVTLTGNRQVSVMGGTLTVGGTINDGGNGYSLTKNGAGTLTLVGTNTYAGSTTVATGVLFVNGSLSNGGVTVASGATLGGNITAGGATTIQSGGTLSVGNSPGMGSFSSLNLAGLTLIQFNANASRLAAGTDFDTINVSTALAYGGELRLAFAGQISNDAGLPFNLINFGSIVPAGNFSTISIYNSAGFVANLIYSSGVWSSSGDLGYGEGSQAFSFRQSTGELAVAPEPSTWAMLLGGIGSLLLFRRRQKK